MNEFIKEYRIPIENYLRENVGDWLADNFYLTYLLIAAILIPVITNIYKWLLKSREKKRISKSSTDIQAYVPEWLVKKLLNEYIQTKIQLYPPSKFAELKESLIRKRIKRIPAINYFCKDVFKKNVSKHKFFLLFGDSGMGKTTFLINLFHYCNLSQNKYKLKYLPLGIPGIDREIIQISEHEKSNTILILDGFDEDAKARLNYNDRLNELTKLSLKFRFVIISCRTQFFPKSFEEPLTTHLSYYAGKKGFHEFERWYISPFNEHDIRKYLRKKFGTWNIRIRIKASRIVNKSPNLMVRPMLLDNIEYLIGTEKDINYAHQIYKILITKWIERESNKFNKESERISFKTNLMKFSQDLSLLLFNRNEYSIDGKEIEELSSNYDIILDEFEMKNRSLLNRDVSGAYKFSHKSIQEYFIAQYAVKDAFFHRTSDFTGYTYVQLFIDELEWGNYSSIAALVRGDIVLFISDKNKTITLTNYKPRDIDIIKNAKGIFVFDYYNIDDINLLLLAKKEINYHPDFILFLVPLSITTVEIKFIESILKNNKCKYLIENKLISIYNYLSKINEIPESPIVFISINSANTDYSIIYEHEIIHHYYTNHGSNRIIDFITEYFVKQLNINTNPYTIKQLLLQMSKDTLNSSATSLQEMDISLTKKSVTYNDLSLNISELSLIVDRYINEVHHSILHLLEQSNPEFAKDLYTNGIFLFGEIFSYSIFKPIFSDLHFSLKLPFKIIDIHSKNAEFYNDFLIDYLNIPKGNLVKLQSDSKNKMKEIFLKKQEINPLTQRLSKSDD